MAEPDKSYLSQYRSSFHTCGHNSRTNRAELMENWKRSQIREMLAVLNRTTVCPSLPLALHFGSEDRSGDPSRSSSQVPWEKCRALEAASLLGHPVALNRVTSRYGVSLLAAARKWVDFTGQRAAMVVSRDGFARWV